MPYYRQNFADACSTLTNLKLFLMITSKLKMIECMDADSRSQIFRVHTIIVFRLFGKTSWLDRDGDFYPITVSGL